MTDKCFLRNLTNFISTRINDNFVVHWLSCEELMLWMYRYGRNAVHSGISDVLYWHWNIELPHKSSLVDTNFLPSSKNVTVLQGWRWWLYSWHICPVLMSHW
jgi:hypothetical protein